MVQYVYEKYNTRLAPGYYYDEQVGTSSGTRTGSVTGATSFTRDNGSYNFIGSATIPLSSSGTLYFGGGSSLDVVSYSGENFNTTSYVLKYSDGYTEKGTFHSRFFAENGTYPTNGLHTDGFWYERKIIATPPTVIAPNGGEVWNNVQTITWSNSQVGLKYKVEISKNNGQSWSTLIAETAVDATSYSRNFLNESQSNLAKVRVTGINNGLFTMSDESNGVFSIQHNVAPLTPTLLEPIGGKKNVENIIRFAWRHNDTDSQSKAELRIREQGTTVWLEENTITGSNQETYALVDAGIAPTNVEWQVRTYDQQNLVSPWSNIAVFEVGFPTAEPVITSPIGTVSNSRPVIQWDSPTQTSYQITITDVDNVLLWDTGEVTSTSKSRTSGIDFVNGATYRINVRSKDASGIFSDYVQSEVITSYTPPAKPIVQAYKATGAISLSIEHPTPIDTQPIVLNSDVYKLIDGTWTRIAAGINGTYTDYLVKSDVSYEYRVVTFGDNDTSVVSDVAVQSIKLSGTWLHVESNPNTSHQFKYVELGRNDNRAHDYSKRRYAGRNKPVVVFSEYEERDIQLTFTLLKRDADWQALQDIYYARQPIVYRDGRGRMLIGIIGKLPSTDAFYGNSVSVTFEEVDYREGV